MSVDDVPATAGHHMHDDSPRYDLDGTGLSESAQMRVGDILAVAQRFWHDC